ncbi:MAG: protein-tyrosine phosphatase family protein, partial [Pseudorhodobacter sp.]
ELRAILARGGRLMVHCRGGCGRTGMIALRLMVDTGEEPGAALARLRAVRPCAVETDAQEVWASV